MATDTKTKALQGGVDPGYITGYCHSAIAQQVAILDHGRPLKQIGTDPFGQRIIFRVQRLGCPHTKVNGVGFILMRLMDQHKAATTDTTHPGFDSNNSSACCDRGVYGITTISQNIGTDF